MPKKYTWKLLCLVSILSQGFPALTLASDGLLDLSKFIALSTVELEKNYGEENLEPTGKIYFQDGAGVGGPTISDFATITYVRKPKIKLEHKDIKYLGFRLALNGQVGIMNVFESTCAPPICQTPGGIALGFSFAGSAVVYFAQGTSLSQMKKMGEKISTLYKDVEITYLEQISVLLFKSHPLDAPGIIGLLEREKGYTGFDVDFETYTYPIEFDAAKEIKDTVGVIDVDSFRSVTKYYKNKGIPFATETTIPVELKP